jgi:hypothetical protein
MVVTGGPVDQHCERILGRFAEVHRSQTVGTEHDPCAISER